MTINTMLTRMETIQVDGSARDDVKRIDAELTRHGKPHDFVAYAGAGHAFLNFTNAERHRPQQADDAWRTLLAFLDRQLG